MSWLGRIGARPWGIAIAAVAGLLGVNVLAGVVGLVLNQSVKAVTDQALRYDVKLEDLSDDLRVAVLDLRHFHRNITFGSPSRGAIADFEQAYAVLNEEINLLERLGIRDPEAPTAPELRAMVEAYYADFRPAVEHHELDPTGFTRASDHGLMRLTALESATETLDHLGERRAASALQQVDDVTTSARLVLLTVIAGLILVGVVLAYAALRVVRELQQLYDRQQTAADALAAASQAKTAFIADVSHELRTPLTVLRGNAEVGLELERECVHAPILVEIVKESASMARMVEDLLFLARSDGVSPPLEVELVDIAPFLAGLAGRAEMLARERGAVFLTALAGAGWLRVDPARIEQAVLILVDNAAKYAPSGERIDFSSSTDHRELRLEVADRGPGIPVADLPHIFERFYRVDKVRSRKQEGTGLGLSIARTIVEAHGGQIEAESRLGEGTRMTIRLPLFEVAPAVVRPLGPAGMGDAR